MSVLKDSNPITAFVWLMLTAVIAMFCMNPLLLGISILGGALYYALRNPGERLRAYLFYVLLFLASALLNPLFSHNGRTVLWVMNDNPVTLEALIYGMVLGGMMIAVLLWFRSFQQIMTSDRLLYVFGLPLPKLTLILSVVLRYIPLFKNQAARVRDSQRALGLFSDESLMSRLRGELRIFSVLVSWALENGIVTADSMSARGYGIGRRTRFALFRFRKFDVVLNVLALLLGGTVVFAIWQGALNCSFYPVFRMPDMSLCTVCAYSAYALLALMPSLLELEENIRWKSLTSVI